MSGYAKKLVKHLGISNENYKVAIELLNAEFFNKPALTNELIKKLLELKPNFDESYLGTKIFISEVRCVLSDLNSYGYDFVDNEPSNILVSHIIFKKLPFAFQQELVRKIDNNYPKITEVFDNYVDVIKTLNLRKPRFDRKNLIFLVSLTMLGI